MTPREWDGSGDPPAWITGNYADAAARLVFLERQKRLGAGWHSSGWQDPEALLRQLDEQLLDPEQARAEARRIEARRLTAPDRHRLDGHEAWLWLMAHPPEHGEPE